MVYESIGCGEEGRDGDDNRRGGCINNVCALLSYIFVVQSPDAEPIHTYMPISMDSLLAICLLMVRFQDGMLMPAEGTDVVCEGCGFYATIAYLNSGAPLNFIMCREHAINGEVITTHKLKNKTKTRHI